MSTNMHPPANQRCQIYGDTSERCINNGTHWVSWGRCQHPGSAHDTDNGCDVEFFSWECDTPHRFGETASAYVAPHKEAA